MNVTRTSSGITVELTDEEAGQVARFLEKAVQPFDKARVLPTLARGLTDALASEPPSLVGGKAIYPWGRK